MVEHYTKRVSSLMTVCDSTRGVEDMPELDRAAAVLHISPAQAQVTVAALQAAFNTNGKTHSFDATAKIIFETLKHPDSNDPDVLYATEWLRA